MAIKCRPSSIRMQVIPAQAETVIHRETNETTTLLAHPFAPHGPKSTLLLRLMAGGVFLWEGILKFVCTNQGIGRFFNLGIPLPHCTANFVAGLKIGGGHRLISGLLRRLIAIPFVVEMIAAILSTKISVYLESLPLPLRRPRRRLGRLECGRSCMRCAPTTGKC
jgi:hypothetical protein